MLSWFDANPDRYWWVACIVTAATLFILLRPMLKPQWIDIKCPDWTWSSVIVALLAVGRWPTWYFARQFNEDESQLIAGAITLRHDPVFWRAVDGGTAGPFDFYALLPVGWLHGADDFASARITALLLIALALIFAHQTLALVCGRQVARVSTFSATYLESFTLSTNLLHYSTELVPVTLLTFAFWAGIRRFAARTSWLWNIAGGFALGAVPFAKLQAGPAALLLGVFWIAGEISSRENLKNCGRNLTALCAGALSPLMFIVLVLTTTGQLQHAFISYILSNINYLNAPGLDTARTIAALWGNAALPGALMASWMAGCAIWLLLTLPFSRAAAGSARQLAAAAVGLLLISLASVMAPHRPYLHYCQLLVVPGTLVFGTVTGMVTETLKLVSQRCGLLCVALLFSVGAPIYERAEASPFYIGWLARVHQHPQEIIAIEIMKFARPGESLGLWGWMNRCYVETGLRQATRSAVSYGEIEPGPYQDYYRNRYLADFERSLPSVFVDTVGKSSLYFQDPRQVHDQVFPALAAFIRRNYSLMEEVDNSRIYVRKDRFALIASQSAQPPTH